MAAVTRAGTAEPRTRTGTVPGGCSQTAWDATAAGAERLFSCLSTGRSEGAEGPAGDREAGLGGELHEEGGNSKGCPAPEVPASGSERDRGNVCRLSPQEAWLLSRERELREEVRKERDKEIELVIQRLEADMSSAKEECERAAENRSGGEGGGSLRIPAPHGLVPFPCPPNPAHLSSELRTLQLAGVSSVSAGRSGSQGRSLPLT